MSVTSSQVREMSRPCDLCRRGKRRCDGPEQADRACSRCKQMSKVCSYVDPAEHNRAARHAYITALESRLETVEALLQRHVPDAVLMHELGILAMNTTPASAHQHGTYGGEVVPEAISSFRALEPWDEAIALSHQHPGHDSLDRQALLHSAQQKRRPEFWCTLNYEFRGERLEDRDLDLVLPPPDRLASLTQAYFDHWNPNFPIFHRALFEQQLLNNKSAPDKKFTVAVLLACALGESRLTNYTDHTERGQQPSGWDFFLHVEPFLRVPTPAHPQLLDLQIFFLATLYTAFIQHNFVAWTLFGTAIRLAYLADAHRRDKYNRQQPNLLDELWKRTFWVLVVVDRMGASFYGRPLMMKDESFNLDLPLEVDDTCWDIGAPGFPLRNTPVTKQGSISFFVWHIQLVLILGVSIQTIYSINRSRLLMGFVGSDWEQRITSKIDLMLNAWAEDVPVHLRWDLNATDLPRFCQSSFLEARYHTLRISAHNPFMRTTARDFAYAAPSSRTAAGLTSSLAICTASAVACSEVVVGVVERFLAVFCGLGGSTRHSSAVSYF
ncbi:fungal-specific transcription factor domain-containing protein [Auriculariales sp. MPI-PUGE-AT-0066]|nr:fungal-specific transcription factor domain-containing protein [Auriculariales sp. MPI-PUGE-AT-0066]